MTKKLSAIYHLTPAGYYRSQPEQKPYLAATFAQEGFIHCAGGVDMLVKVANAYFADLAEPLLVLEIDPARLSAPLKFEPPIPPLQATTRPDYGAESDMLFPHIYGPVNRQAIRRCFALQRNAAGRWQFPEKESQ